MSKETYKIHSQRPLSPHLQIYKPQISSVLSILHRITGFALYVGVILFAWWLVANAYGCGKCINSLFKISLVRVFIFGWTLALYYHLLNGIRHLFWDIGKGYGLCIMQKTGWLVLVGTVLLSVGSWYVF